MAEEVDNPTVKLPNAISLCVPVGGIAGLFFIMQVNSLPFPFRPLKKS